MMSLRNQIGVVSQMFILLRILKYLNDNMRLVGPNVILFDQNRDCAVVKR